MRRTIFTLLLLCAFLLVAVVAWAGILPPEKHPRRLAQAVFANGKVYWVGGRALPGATITDMDPLHLEPGLTVGKTYWDNRQGGFSIYDPATNTWAAAKYDMTGPQGLSWKGSLICSEDGMGGSGSYPGQSQTMAFDYDEDDTMEIFIHGGYPTWDGAFYMYDPDTDIWDRIYGMPNNPFGDGSLSCQYRGVADYDERTGICYCYGGTYWSALRNGFAKCDLKTGEWTVLPAGPVEIVGSVGGVVNGKLYVIGGTQKDVNTGTEDILAATGIWEYDIDTATWNGKIADLIQGVRYPAVAKYNNKFYICGGDDGLSNVNTAMSGTDYTIIQVFDPATKTVTHIGNLPVAMSEGGAAINPADGMLYVGGGRHTNFDNSTQWWKTDVDVTPLTWTQIPDDPACFPYVDFITGNEKITGTVKMNDIPLPDVKVGIMLRPNAAADPLWYAITDENGYYELQPPYNRPGGGSHVYLAAYKEGFKSTDYEVTLPAGGSQVVDINLNTLVNKNIAPSNIGCASRRTFASQSDNPEVAFDGNLDTIWYMDGPKMEQTPSQEDYIIADLGSDVAINGITMILKHRIMRYRVDIMQGGDPLNPLCWATPAAFGATVSTVYTGRGMILDMDYDPSPPIETDPLASVINLPPTYARGVRVYFDPIRNEPWDRGIREVMIHSSTEPGGLIMGKIKNGSGDAVYNAAVQLGGIGSSKVVITDASGLYSISSDPGTYELYADAAGYAATTSNVTVPAGTPYVNDVTLTAASEPVVYNADFETQGWNPFVADGWELVINPSANPDMYSGSRDIDEGANTTPGGTASGWITTGAPNATEPYWYPGWLRLTEGHKLTVDPSKVYNFYFKTRMKEGWALGFWKLVWRAADGTETGAVNSGWLLPGNNNWMTVYNGEFAGGAVKPMIRMTPPAGTTWAEIQLGIDGWPGDTGVAVTFNWDDLVFDASAAPYIALDKLSDLATKSNGDLVSFTSKQITALPGNGVPSGIAYVEETDRYAGLRLDISGVTLDPSTAVGDGLSFRGRVETTAAGEKYLVVTGIDGRTTGLTPIEPLAMTNRVATTSLARALYAKVWGTVSASGSNYFIINDGSVDAGNPIPIKVYCSGAVPTSGFVKLKGVVSKEGADTVVYMTDPAVE